MGERIQHELDRNTDLLNAKTYGHEEGMAEGMVVGKAEGKMEEREAAHMKALERFQKQALKRFPALSPATQQTVFMINETQLDQQNEMILDYPDQKAFEIELQKIADEQQK